MASAPPSTGKTCRLHRGAGIQHLDGGQGKGEVPLSEVTSFSHLLRNSDGDPAKHRAVICSILPGPGVPSQCTSRLRVGDASLSRACESLCFSCVLSCSLPLSCLRLYFPLACLRLVLICACRVRLGVRPRPRRDLQAPHLARTTNPVLPNCCISASTTACLILLSSQRSRHRRGLPSIKLGLRPTGVRNKQSRIWLPSLPS